MKRRNRGQILVLFTLSLVVLIGFAALGVDVGYMYSVRHELQRCADAGALAGASYFKETGYWSSTPGDLQMAIAEARARTFASRDNVVTSPLDYNNEIFVTFPESFKIRVGTERTVGLFFSRLFLGPTKKLRAFAVAEAYPVTEKVTCIVPWGIPAPWPDDGDGAFNNGETFVWPESPEDWIQYTTDHCNGAVTGWDQDNHIIVGTKNGRDNYLCQGSLQALKIGQASGDNVVQPGNFYGIDLSSIVKSCPGMEPNPGADFYSYMITHSCECDFTVDVDDEFDLDTKTGNMVGPTIKPVAPDQYYGLPDPATDYYAIDDKGKKVTLPSAWQDVGSIMNGDPNAQWVDDAQFDGGHPESGNSAWAWGEGGTGDWKSSPRIIKIPVYSPDPNYKGGIHTPEKPGKTSFQPLGFVGFWVQDIQYFPPNNGTIVGRFVTVEGWGVGSSDPGPAGTPVLNIRLVE